MRCKERTRGHPRFAILAACLLRVVVSGGVTSGVGRRVLIYAERSAGEAALAVTLASTQSGVEETYPMMDANGVDYACHIPALHQLSVAEVMERDLASRLQTALTQLRASLAGRCMYKRLGAQVLELCYDSHVSVRALTTFSGAAVEADASTTPARLAASTTMTGGSTPFGKAGSGLHLHYTADEHSHAAVRVDADGGYALVKSFADAHGVRHDVTLRCARSSMRADAPALDIEAHLASGRVDVITSDDVLCSLLPTPHEFLASAKGPCYTLTEDWWTYEVCAGKSVRQYHLQPDGTTVAEHLLGKFNPHMPETVWQAQEARPVGMQQHYTDGTRCDVAAQQPRTAVVRFVCREGVAHWSASPAVTVREASSCVYEVTVFMDSMCAYPSIATHVRALSPATDASIHCIPA